MAVYQCQCDLILSTPDRHAHCPRCRRPLVEGDRLYLGRQNPHPPMGMGGKELDAADSVGPTRLIERGLHGFAFAIAHIRSVGQAWLSH